MSAVVCASDAILAQLDDLVGSIGDESYTFESKVVKGGTIGKHLRHTLDHFKGAILTPSSEKIDYDHRARGTGVESDREEARREIAMIRSALGDMDAELLSESVTAHVMCSCDGVCEDLGSTRGREIFFAMHHAIHHNAIINAIALELGIDLPDGFGKAPSTVNFETSTTSAS